MVQPNIEKHILKRGELCYKATPEQPLIYYTGKAGSRGLINMKLENEGKEFIIIPVEE
ncbi:MAG: hypothetical protein LLG05_16555 [Porphyromonadaceae bacterium]|nr:hypothetical protein [Porphyromonadaceae bacterium]